MRKFLVSASLIVSFVVYAFLNQPKAPAAPGTAPIAGGTARAIPSEDGEDGEGISWFRTAPQAAPAQAPAPSAPAAVAPARTTAPAAASRTGLYTDGAYTGDPADAYYGTVQVRATVSGGRITDVTFLQHPSDRRTSQEINNMAMPLLSREAIQAQNANVDTVSGASDTSAAFRQSLASALAQARK